MNWVALAALISAGINFVTLGISIRYHCRNDDRRFGAMEARLKMMEADER